MYTPTLAQARKLVGSARFVPMYREILADLETPVSAYLKYAAGRDSFLLESVEGIEHVGRYSFIGARPREILDIREGGTATRETPDGTRTLDYDDPLELIDAFTWARDRSTYSTFISLRRTVSFDSFLITTSTGRIPCSYGCTLPKAVRASSSVL